MLHDYDMVVQRKPKRLKGGRLVSGKYNWPFKNMIVGQRVIFKDERLIPLARRYIHAFGKMKGWKFKTWMDNDRLVIMRDINPRQSLGT